MSTTAKTQAVQEYLSLQRAITNSSTQPPCLDSVEAWFNDDYRVRQLAAQACQRCPLAVFTACSRYADIAGERWGVWAGTDRTTHPAKKRKEAA